MLPRPLGGALGRRGGKQIPAPPSCLNLNIRLWLVLVFPTHCYSISFTIGPQFPSVAHTHTCTHACLHACPLSHSPSEKETEALPLRTPVSFKPTILTCLSQQPALSTVTPSNTQQPPEGVIKSCHILDRRARALPSPGNSTRHHPAGSFARTSRSPTPHIIKSEDSLTCSLPSLCPSGSPLTHKPPVANASALTFP